MNSRLRELLRRAFETGYARGVGAFLDGDVRLGQAKADTNAAIEGASAEWLAELLEQAEREEMEEHNERT